MTMHYINLLITYLLYLTQIYRLIDSHQKGKSNENLSQTDNDVLGQVSHIHTLDSGR